MGELSQQLPLRLMDERTPHFAKAAWKSRLQYWLSLSLWKMAPSSDRLRHQAIAMASLGKLVFI